MVCCDVHYAVVQEAAAAELAAKVEELEAALDELDEVDEAPDVPMSDMM